jgi:hypothetical protein
MGHNNFCRTGCIDLGCIFIHLTLSSGSGCPKSGLGQPGNPWLLLIIEFIDWIWLVVSRWQWRTHGPFPGLQWSLRRLLLSLRGLRLQAFTTLLFACTSLGILRMSPKLKLLKSLDTFGTGKVMLCHAAWLLDMRVCYDYDWLCVHITDGREVLESDSCTDCLTDLKQHNLNQDSSKIILVFLVYVLLQLCARCL